jgi:hypothetical protein
VGSPKLSLGSFTSEGRFLLELLHDISPSPSCSYPLPK